MVNRATIAERGKNHRTIVEATVIEANEIATKNFCGFEVGDKLIFDGIEIKGIDKDGKEFPAPTCYSVLQTLLMSVFAMQYGATFPWEFYPTKPPTPSRPACPDAKYRIVFELKRYDKETGEFIPPEKVSQHPATAPLPAAIFRCGPKK